MKILIGAILIIMIVISCNPDTSEMYKQPIVYLGIDTTYDNQPTEAYCVHTNKLSIISQDSIILYLQHIPTAPIDSPYRIHGSSMSYYGIMKSRSRKEIGKVKWNFDPSEDIFCNNESTNQIQSKKNKITLIDLTKDTLCIGDIECIKQK